jgi:hypothetical protein
MLKKTLGVLALAGLTACSYPQQRVATVDARPQLAFNNAPATAEVYLDGVSVGPAARYDGKSGTLGVSRGTHKLDVMDGGRAIHSESLYLGDDTLRTINLSR